MNLQNCVIGNLGDSVSLVQSGLLLELPEAINIDEYSNRLKMLRDELQTLPTGDAHAAQYEDLIGEAIKLCFFRSLTNIEPKSRNHSGRVIRDWVASNSASSGFWEMVFQRYQATQIVWECKNYANLDADAFHQASYYMTSEIGRFVVLCFRGQVKNHHYGHIQRVANKDKGIILLLTDQDIQTFIRQSLNGRVKEDHIRQIFDRTVREIS